MGYYFESAFVIHMLHHHHSASVVYFRWSEVFGCNYIGQRYACGGWKLVPCRLGLLGKVRFS
ncbi:hypothetical protein Hanom_Chr04g00336251 [Helianthus anomalus]